MPPSACSAKASVHSQPAADQQALSASGPTQPHSPGPQDTVLAMSEDVTQHSNQRQPGQTRLSHDSYAALQHGQATAGGLDDAARRDSSLLQVRAHAQQAAHAAVAAAPWWPAAGRINPSSRPSVEDHAYTYTPGHTHAVSPRHGCDAASLSAPLLAHAHGLMQDAADANGDADSAPYKINAMDEAAAAAAAAAAYAAGGQVHYKDRGTLYAIVFGIINAVVTMPTLVAYTAIVFQSPEFTPYLGSLCKFFFFSSAIHQMVFVLRSSLPFAIGQVR